MGLLHLKCFKRSWFLLGSFLVHINVWWASNFSQCPINCIGYARTSSTFIYTYSLHCLNVKKCCQAIVYHKKFWILFEQILRYILCIDKCIETSSYFFVKCIEILYFFAIRYLFGKSNFKYQCPKVLRYRGLKALWIMNLSSIFLIRLQRVSIKRPDWKGFMMKGKVPGGWSN